ncbi:MAG: GntR family transcriptional regulator [Acidobacteriota bacterium]
MKGRQKRATQFATSEVPLYYQLGTILREQVVSGRYAPGDQLPTETQLVEAYGVSRITVRQALKALEEQGLVRREAGRGTFVTGGATAPKPLQMNGSLDDLITMGLATSVKLLDLRQVTATRVDADALDIDEGDPLMQCSRLRVYKKAPYSYIVNRLPLDIAEKFKDHDWEKGAILQSIEKRLGLRLREADQEVRASLADASLARLLETRIGAPILSVDRIVRTDTNRAVERVHTFYRGDIYSLNVHLTREPDRARQARDWTLKSDAKR